MAAIRKGDQVDTPDLGRGDVTHVSANAVLVRLHAHKALEVRFLPDELRAVTPRAEPEERREAIPGLDRLALERRAGVEALRFGLVPNRCIEEITVGFSEIKRWVEGRLPDRAEPGPMFSQVCGSFGVGKSHMMSIVRFVAEKAGFAVANVEVDGRQVSFSDPGNLLFALWANLRVDGRRSATPLLDLYVRAIDRGVQPPRIAPRGIDRVRDNFELIRSLKRIGRLDDFGSSIDAVVSSSPDVTANVVTRELIQGSSLAGSDINLRRMVGLRVEERPYDFVEALVGHAVLAQQAGLRGLVFTIDEFEVEHIQNRFGRARKTLEMLGRYLSGDLEGHPRAPLAIFVATVGQGGSRGDPLLESLAEEGATYEVPLLSDSQQHDLARRIHRLYASTYGVDGDLEDELIESVRLQVRQVSGAEGGFTRAFIKGLVSELDARHEPRSNGLLV